MFRIAFYGAILFGVIFTAVSVWGIKTVVEAQRLGYHTSTVLDEIALTQKRIAAADQAGRAAITDLDTRPVLPALRDAAFQSIDRLREITADDPHQQINLDTLDGVVRTRFSAQDGQIASVKVDGAHLTFSDVSVARAQLSLKMVDDSLDNIRRDELTLLGERMISMVNTELSLSIGAVICAVLFGVSFVIMVREMLKELRKQRGISADLRNLAMERTEDGLALAISEKDMIAIANKIDGALGNETILRTLVML